MSRANTKCRRWLKSLVWIGMLTASVVLLFVWWIVFCFATRSSNSRSRRLFAIKYFMEGAWLACNFTVYFTAVFALFLEIFYSLFRRPLEWRECDPKEATCSAPADRDSINAAI